MATRAEGVEPGVVGDRAQHDAEEGEDQADQGADVLEQHDRQLGLLGPADERPPAGWPRFTLCASWMAVRNEYGSSPIATRRMTTATPRLSTSCGWRSFSMPS